MKRSLSVKDLRAKCQSLEQGVLARKLATTADIDACRPGGSENPDSGPQGWLVFHGELHRFHARGEAVATAVRGLEGVLEGDALGLELFANQPKEVRCTPLPGDQEGKVYRVHPKGLGALIACHERDERLQWLALHADFIRDRGGPEDNDLLQRIDEEMVKHLALICWIITSPGPGLPYDPNDATPVPPTEFRQLDLADLIAIQHAHLVVNGLRIELVRRSVLGRRTPETAPGATMLRWTTFVGQAAIEMKRRPHELMWDWTLAELLLAAAASAEANRQARESADTKSGGGS